MRVDETRQQAAARDHDDVVGEGGGQPAHVPEKTIRPSAVDRECAVGLGDERFRGILERGLTGHMEQMTPVDRHGVSSWHRSSASAAAAAGVESSGPALRPRDSAVKSAERLGPKPGDGAPGEHSLPASNGADRCRRRPPRSGERAHGRNRSHRTKAAKPRERSANTVDGIPPLARLFPLGLQHVLAMYAGAVAVPLIVGGALGLLGRGPRVPDQRRPVRCGHRDDHPVHRVLAVRCTPAPDAGRHIRRRRPDDRDRSESRASRRSSARRSRAACS